MSEIATLSVDVIAHDKVSNVLAQIEAKLVKTDAAAQRAGQSVGRGIGGGAKTAADGTLTLAQAQARLLTTTGQNQAAYTTLSSALTKTSGSAVQTVRAQTQLAQIQNRLTGTSQSLTSLFGQMSSQMSGLGGSAGQAAGAFGNLAGSMGTLGAIGAGLAIAKVAADMAIAGANADLVRQRFDGLAEAAGTTGEALLQAMRVASGGEITDLNLELAANRANLLGVADSAEEMATLLAIARDRAQQLGTSSAKAFDDLVTGLGRGSPLILDNLGIMVSVEEANKKYADSLGVTVSALTEAQKKQALINDVLEQGRASLAATGGAVQSNAGTFAALGTTLSNAGTMIGTAFADVAAPSIEQFNTHLQQTMDATQAVVGFFAQLGTVSAASAAEAQAQAAATAAYSAALEQSGSVVQANAAFEAAYTASLQQSTQAAGASVGPMAAAAAGQQALGVAAQAATTAQTALTTELQTNAQAAVLAAAKQAAQSTETANLTATTNAAVTAFLNLNPNIDAAGIAAAVAAGKIPALIGQLAGLRIAAYSARDAIAALAAQQAINTKVLAQPGIAAPGRTSGANNDIDAVLRLQKANQDAADAKSDQLLAIGTQQEKLTELTRQYNEAVKTGGADSAAAIQAQTRLRQEQIAAEKAATKGAKGGVAAKLTDQAKLNNSLLASQEQYAQKAEQAESDHLDRILQINSEFGDRIRKAQDQFAQSQLEGRAGFYDTLGSIEDAGLRQALSAQYEAAFQEADQIAREKGADVGQKFLEAKQAAIEAQGQRASEIAEATKEGDKDKAAYLAGVDKLYREAEERKLNAIKAGEGSVAAERDQALADESAKYAESQAKIADSADTAATRKILAAERAGQAVDAEGLKVDTLAAKYDALALSGARAGVAAVTTPAGAGATAAGAAGTTAAAAPVDVVSALSAAQSAIVAAIGSMVSAEKDTTSAVRGLQSKFQS